MMTLMTPMEKLAEWQAFYGPIADPHERLSLIISRPSALPSVPIEARTEMTLVRGCQTAVWLQMQKNEGRYFWAVEAASPLVRGLVRLQVELFHGCEGAEILEFSGDAWQTLGLRAHLSPTRLHGLAAVRERICDIVRATMEA